MTKNSNKYEISKSIPIAEEVLPNSKYNKDFLSLELQKLL